MKIEDVIKQIRRDFRKSKWSRAELARRADLSHSTLIGFFDDKIWNPRLSTLKALQKALRKVNA